MSYKLNYQNFISAFQTNFSTNAMPFNTKSGINTTPLSPRQTGYNHQSGQANSNQNWQNTVRMSVQHNNPMLSAQLQVGITLFCYHTHF